jgi:hypothetical protein
MSQIITPAFSVTTISLKTRDTSFSIVFSVLESRITYRFHGVLEIQWSPLVGQKVLYRSLFLRDCHPHLLVHLEAKKWMDF